MSLDVAANVARQSLLATQQQIALSGRNVAVAGDPTRSRAGAELATYDGGVRIVGTRRAEDQALYTRMINATSETAERDAVLTHLEALATTVGDPDDGSSPAALIGDLEAALADYANAPSDPLFGIAAVERAKDLAQGLNRAASELEATRQRADAEMKTGVDEVNRLLVDFDTANTLVKRLTVGGDDATAALDRRDAIVAKISEHIGVTTMTRTHNDMALFTDGGVTLFDKTAREVTFDHTEVFAAGTVGASVFVDGIEVVGPDAKMPSTAGAIVGNARYRDDIAPVYRLQLDEVARVLTETFEDGIGSLFVNDGAPDMAGTIRVPADVDPAQGGSVDNLRDGTGNPSGFASYADRLMQLSADLDVAVAFDPAAELGDQANAKTFATGSIGWLEGLRAKVTGEAEAERAVLSRASDALSSATGVNMDEEYANQLAIERNFAASSRLLSIVDEMFNELLRIA